MMPITARFVEDDFSIRLKHQENSFARPIPEAMSLESVSSSVPIVDPDMSVPHIHARALIRRRCAK